MKTTSFIVALALCAAARAMASDQPKQEFIDASSTKVEVHSGLTVNPFAQTKEAKDENKIDRVGGMSSQPWSQIASRNSGGSDTLSEMQNQECGLPLLSVGAQSHPW